MAEGDGQQQGGGEPQAEPARAGDQTWLVQRRDMSDAARQRKTSSWIDVGQIVVPPRTKRRTIIEKALSVYPDAAPPKDGAGVEFRVLDFDSFSGIPVRWEVPPAPAPELRIG